MELAAQLRREFVGRRLDQRLQEQLVGTLVELGDCGDGLERLFVGPLETVESRDDVLQPALGELHFVLDLPVSALALVDRHCVQAGWQRLDRLQHRDDLCMLLLRHLSGHEDAEMPDVLVHRPTMTWPRALISSVEP